MLARMQRGSAKNDAFAQACMGYKGSLQHTGQSWTIITIRVALIADTWMMGLPTLTSISSSWSPDLGPAVQRVRK